VIPSGCSPPILTMFADARPPKYDPKTGCLRAHNELGIHHNTLLQDSLRRLRAKHPGVTIVYADFFSPVMEMIESPHKFGELLKDCRARLNTLCGDGNLILNKKVNLIDEMTGFRQDVLQVCCGGPGRYNYNDSVSCGDPGATACESPSSSLYFDGVHLTEPGYRYVADGWLNSINSAASANTRWCRSEL
jgi:phospholipase/lecithinase/hemolysin